MTTQSERAAAFADLHIKGRPLILYNIWDAGSAKAVAEMGAKAIATGSWSVAAAHGYADGEKLPFDLVIGNLRRIVASVDLPVTVDLEGGYGVSPADLHERITQVIGAGAVGINFEDQVVGGEGLYSIEAQSGRIAAVREAADRAGVPLYINARTDVFIKNAPETHASHLDEAIERAAAYAAAGASGFFAPVLSDLDLIGRLCAAVTLPVNIMYMASVPPVEALAQAGVARLSYGAFPYRAMISALKEAAKAVL